MHPTLFQIMAVLGPGPSEAVGILDALREVGGEGAVPSLPAFYRHLRRALDEGWVVVEGSEPAEGPGRPAQSYALTREGREALREHAERLERFTRLAAEGAGGTDGGGRAT